MFLKRLGERCVRIHNPTFRVRAVNIYFNHPLRTSWSHGDKANPSKWPWWKFFHLAHNQISVVAPTTGHRFWLYTRKTARDFDVVFDRRANLGEASQK